MLPPYPTWQIDGVSLIAADISPHQAFEIVHNKLVEKRSIVIAVARVKPEAEMEEWEQEMWLTSTRMAELARLRRLDTLDMELHSWVASLADASHMLPGDESLIKAHFGISQPDSHELDQDFARAPIYPSMEAADATMHEPATLSREISSTASLKSWWPSSAAPAPLHTSSPKVYGSTITSPQRDASAASALSAKVRDTRPMSSTAVAKASFSRTSNVKPVQTSPLTKNTILPAEVDPVARIATWLNSNPSPSSQSPIDQPARGGPAADGSILPNPDSRLHEVGSTASLKSFILDESDIPIAAAAPLEAPTANNVDPFQTVDAGQPTASATPVDADSETKDKERKHKRSKHRKSRHHRREPETTELEETDL